MKSRHDTHRSADFTVYMFVDEKEQRMSSVIETMICGDVEEGMSGTGKKKKKKLSEEHFETTHILTRSTTLLKLPCAPHNPHLRNGD